MKQFDVIILGAGAGGLMCAAQLSEKSSLKIAIIEGNTKPALKLKASGGGKCNLTNVEVDASHFLGNESLVSNALRAFSKEALLEYFHNGGLRPVIRKERYYFCPKSSDEVISILLGRARGCDMLLGHKILSVAGNAPFVVTTDKGKFSASNIVVATGGASYKELGASDIGLKIAQEYGHKVIPFAPALVGLTLQPKEFWMKELSGISFPARIRVGEKLLDEDLLFAHKGISGPVVLSTSLYWHRGEIALDFCPDLELEKLFKEKKLLSTALPLPKRFIKAFLEAISLDDKPCNRLNPDEREKLSKLQNYTMAPSGTFGMSKAEVCRGGVAHEELEIKTMESTRIKGLYFIGETVDVTGELGGYNFQWAFSSAVVCSSGIVNNYLEY
ncbi:MAG: aminoacetone oxidase family FAD-binding enzyme [Sulfuricurvum sp.]|nr:aminoacetone oxidase family FAD-binding enzyme [Sulfuricurvum sp.]